MHRERGTQERKETELCSCPLKYLEYLHCIYTRYFVGYCLQTAHLESGASAVSLETWPTFQTMGCGKDGNPMCFNPITCWCNLDVRFPSFVGPHDVEVLKY